MNEALKKVFWLIVVYLMSPIAYGQVSYTLSGNIVDSENGEVLIGATVYIKELQSGTAANDYGFYSLTIPAGDYRVIYSFMGYESRTFQIKLDFNFRQDVELDIASKDLDEVVVLGRRPDENIRSPQMSVSRLSIKEVSTIHVLFGEQDILKTIQLLPGVQSAGEGSTGYYVRGGDAGQNLILLDEAPVYNPSHLLGFFSIFNSDAISDVKLYKGGVPAEFGGRISSVLDVRMKNGDLRNYRISGGIGLISSRLIVEGPIKKDRGSFIVTGRRTYADAFLAFSKDTLIRNNILYFYDLNVKANYKIWVNDMIYLSC